MVGFYEGLAHEASGLPRMATVQRAALSRTLASMRAEYAALIERAGVTPKASSATPPLPGPWSTGGIPDSAVIPDQGADLGPGELRLDESMAKLWSNALPPAVADAPVSLFNLFKYKDGDRSIHDAYMADFKRTYGESAGATVKFMGLLDGPIRDQATDSAGGAGGGDTKRENVWDDGNLVQYDTIWRYAYMLSTEEHRGMNKQKVAGLQDTCILCVSEIELS